MSVVLIIVGLLVVLYGILRPEKSLPEAVRRPSTLGGSAIFGLLCVAGAAVLSGPSQTDGAAVSAAGPADEAPADSAVGGSGWPGGEAARDSALRAIAALIDAERYVEAEDRALILAAQPFAAPVADSLRRLARLADEMALYAQVRRLSAAAVRDNWLGYADLARRFPDSPRLGEYAARRDAYEQRLIAQEAARYAAPAAPEAPPPADTPAVTETPPPAEPPPCCRVCVRGKPCGNTCIAQDRECRSPPGCACQG